MALYNNAGSSHVIVDVVGWFGPNGTAASGRYNALNPARIVDTRNGTGGFVSPVGIGGTISPKVTGVGGVPASGVSAVVLNVTVTEPTTGGFLTVFPNGTTPPLLRTSTSRPASSRARVMVTAMSAALRAIRFELRGAADQRTEGDEDPLEVRFGQVRHLPQATTRPSAIACQGNTSLGDGDQPFRVDTARKGAPTA